jgi:hypothetical protein
MRVFVKFYPIVDTIKLEVEASTTIGALKNKLYENTNLTSRDKIKVIVKNVPMTSDDVTLWDLSVKEDTTFHVVVQEQKNGPFRINTPHTLGALNSMNDLEIANILSFLDLKSLVQGASLACRKFRTVENQQHHIVWRPLAVRITLEHAEDEHRAKVDEYLSAASKKKLNCKQLFIQRFLRKKEWNQIKEFSLVSQPTQEQCALKFEKEKAIKVKREPRPLTEEEEQFLAENDPNVLRKNLRKDKTAREKLNKHKLIQRKKEEIESGVWKVVPQHFIQFDYETLMQHTFGLHPQNNKDGITGFYESKGKFTFIDKEGKLICLAYIEPEEEFYRFKNIIVDESDTRDPKDVLIQFFELLEQCKARNIEPKKLLGITVNDQGIKGLGFNHVDAIGDVLLVTKKYEADAKLEKPRVEVKRGKELSSPRFGRTTEEPTIFQATTFVYTPKSEEESAAAEQLSFDNLTEAYIALFVAAQKDDDVAILGFPVLEQLYLKKLKLDENEEKNKDFVGSLIAKAVSRFIKEHNFNVQNETQEIEEFNPEEASGKKKRKKAFKKALIVVKDDEEKELVKKGVSTEFDLGN